MSDPLKITIVPGYVEHAQAQIMLTERFTVQEGDTLCFEKEIGLTIEYVGDGRIRITQHRDAVKVPKDPEPREGFNQIDAAIKGGLRKTDLWVLGSFLNPSSERSLQQLQEDLYPESLPEIQETLDRLVKEGTLKAVYRVHSPMTGDGLVDFETKEEIPEYLEDESQDPPEEFKVGPENIKVVYSRGR